MSDESDEVRLVAGGDRAAFTRLVSVHLAPIEAYVTRILGISPEAQDVTQEVMLRLWLRAATFDPERARLTTWLHQMAHNLCIDHIRRNKRLVSANAGSAELGSHNNVTQDDIDQVDPLKTKVVMRALASLPDRQRHALVLTYYQDLSNQEVAAVMDLGVRAVESLLVRARKTVRQYMESPS